ncbi:MAG TPA: glycoside hydrolase family 3 N-terminal domain-containing protein, partial [Thermoleophilaceae bacterium]|nr:glycoside hydrolase family 3 N-terminal domain-containing protein [Thermoleophilaceae bacterium]
GAAAALLLGVLVGVLGGDGAAPPPAPAPTPAAEESPEPATAPEVSALLAEMPLEREVAQLMLVGLESASMDDPTLEAFEKMDYAGLVLDEASYDSPDQVAALVKEVTATARKAKHVEPWAMAPQEGGEFNAFADLPPPKAPGEIRSPEEAAKLAAEAAEELDELGLNGILAPVLDVGPLGGGAVGTRAYSDVPDQVTRYAKATVRAYEKAGIFAAAKHFPGLGAASQPAEDGPVTVGLTVEQLSDRDLEPFRAAIAAGVPGIVVGPGRYAVDDFVVPGSTSEAVLTGLLRDELGFDGVAIADDVTSPAVTAPLPAPRAAVDAIRAGADLVYVSRDARLQREVYDALLEAVQSGSLSEERVDEALRRGLEAKLVAGVLPKEGRGGKTGAGGKGGGRGLDGAKDRESGGGAPGRGIDKAKDRKAPEPGSAERSAGRFVRAKSVDPAAAGRPAPTAPGDLGMPARESSRPRTPDQRPPGDR